MTRPVRPDRPFRPAPGASDHGRSRAILLFALLAVPHTGAGCSAPPPASRLPIPLDVLGAIVSRNGRVALSVREAVELNPLYADSRGSERPVVSGGSATPVGGDLLLTARHVLPPTFPDLVLDGRPVRAAIVAQGTGTTVDTDWALLRIEHDPDANTDDLLPERPPHVDFERPVPIGTPLYMLGYPGFRASVVTTRRIRAGWCRDPIGPTSFFVWTRRAGVNRGLSGGAVALWDDDLDDLVIVGIYQGYTGVRFGIDLLKADIVIRPPIDPALLPNAPPGHEAGPTAPSARLEPVATP